MALIQSVETRSNIEMEIIKIEKKQLLLNVRDKRNLNVC